MTAVRMRAVAGAVLCAVCILAVRCSNPKKPGITENPEVTVTAVTATVAVVMQGAVNEVTSVHLDFYHDGVFLKRVPITDFTETDRAVVPAADVGGADVSLIAMGRDAAGNVVCYGYLDIGVLHPEESVELDIALNWLSLRPETSGLQAKNVNGVCVAPDNTVWAATDSTGICRYDGTAWRVFGTGYGLPAERVLAVWCDRAGRVWAGTETGAYLHNAQNNIWAVHDSLPGIPVYSLAEDPDDSTMYFGTDAGLYRMDASGRWSHPLDEGTVKSIAPAPGDSVWCGTTDNGLVLVTDSLEAAYGTAAGLPAIQTFSVCQAADGRIWCATSGGLAVFDGSSFLEIGQGMFDRSGMQAVAEDAAGVLWAASPFTVYAYRGTAWAEYPRVIESQHLHHLYIDARNYKWFSTRGRGILLYTGS